MRIAINCRSFLNKKYTGIGRYSYNLVKFLSEIDHENKYSLYVQKGIFDFKRKTPKFNAKNFNVKVDRFKKGLDKTLNSIDIYHSPFPDNFEIKNAKIIVTVHDLIYKAFPQGHTQQTIYLTDTQLKSFLPNVSKIICPSKNTINDLHKFFKVPEEKVSLVYQGVDKNVFYKLPEGQLKIAREEMSSLGVKDKYILFVGTIEARKNLKNLLEAFSQLKKKGLFDGKLVVIGMMGWKTEGIAETLKKFEIEDDVLFLGFLSNELLCYFYNLAEAFVFPSFYEGFGYPIIEAFCCGTAVVASNRSSCPEIAQDAALIINPDDPQDIADNISRIVNDEKLKVELINKGFRRAEDFSYLTTAEKTLEVYREVYKSK